MWKRWQHQYSSLRFVLKSLSMLKRFLEYVFDLRLFVLLTFGFITFTVIGTISHESGHYAMARHFGFQADIHYSFTNVHLDQKEGQFFRVTWIRYKSQIKANKTFPEKERYDRIVNQYKRAGIWITFGGPLQTMLTGTIGLIMMIIFRRSFLSSERLSFWLWIIVFITLFWLRQTTNFIMAIFSSIVQGSIRSFGDETYLAKYYNSPVWLISAITALIGVTILVVVIFKFIPVKQRLTFITAGLFGGVTGYIFWLVVFGKMIMP